MHSQSPFHFLLLGQGLTLAQDGPWTVAQTDLAFSVPLPQPSKELKARACTTRSNSNLFLKQAVFVSGTAFAYLVSALSTHVLACIAQSSVRASHKLRCPFSVQEVDLFLIPDHALKSLARF